ncbi:glutamine synthetase-like protein [Thermothelomyces thermophilus ATCC 42464]|uniref:Glutamine synthetase n=1 Tax=Thermothelomyces thermophilus (strain ATCC 42464 / BCRC 31852 / DSM 1799) TaxID=573729 RepID=G2Q852_THET4|nr:glutamine synthetase-like protein [Thermothelomyces thermophilus ATCC 42464]AEO57009.1 glutamine synthetase-like protein [Thermothelomyces thermophilus ATCC 42464]
MVSWAGMRATATPSQVDAVARAIRSTPIIDHHAHPLLKPEALNKHPLLAITTEANGDAIDSTTTTLPHLRAVRQLASVLRCGYTWEAVVAAIEEKRLECPEDWTADCLFGIETILIDDGLDGEDDANAYPWHDDYTRSRCKRIVRIEKIAADIIRRIGSERSDQGTQDASLEGAFDGWVREFDTYIRTALDDPEVVGFKSVVCYRTGLDVATEPISLLESRAAGDFKSLVADVHARQSFVKLRTKSLNDLVVHRTAQLIRDSPSRRKKPIQFHTGLGDSDLALAKASPSHLQEFIRQYPTVPIVLLHAGYPFTRETGYLASVYDNVYADIGEVFPSVSQDGQERILREILELCPWSKILWSTDGHWFPETYLLAILQMREVFETVLCDYVRRGHMGWRAAIDLVRDVLFKNANKLYHLELDFSELEEDGTALSQTAYQSDADTFRAFLKNQPAPDFVRICWNDFTGTQRMRMIPFRKFASLLNEGKPTDIGITTAAFSLTGNDRLVPGTYPTGEYRLHPDFSSLRKGPVEGHISMNGEFRDQSGATGPLCPRSVLQRAVAFGAENDLSFLIGFEIEFLLVERVRLEPRDATTARYSAIPTDGHAWSVSRYFADPKIAALLRDMVATLDEMGIHAEQLHAESATGQFELVLPPCPPVEAADTLLHARDVMSALATAAGYKLTLHPKPFAHEPGTASHMHMSLSSAGGDRPEVYQPLYAGILRHLRGIAAFTYANPASYERATDGAWSGGRWVTWGTQNRETALRKIAASHWELKWMDGLANPYLAVAAVLFAGVRGVADREPLVWGDCEIDPSKLTADDRKELGVTQMVPANLGEALRALKEDRELVEFMGAELVDRYVAVKSLELEILGKMGDEERRQWLMGRY